MRLRHYNAVRFEDVLPEGRTNPLVLTCRPLDGPGPATPKVVKAIGCPEIVAVRQLVSEIFGNATARRMRIQTPDPCIVHIGQAAARIVNLSLREQGYLHEVQPGPAAGCDLISPAPIPYTVGQDLTPELRIQAVWLYVFDLLSQNPDRRRDKVNCGLTPAGLLGFDFEMCFGHLFLPIIGGLFGNPWEPSKDVQMKSHLFYEVVRANPPSQQEIADVVANLDGEWLDEICSGLPATWNVETDKIENTLRVIANHAEDFARDVVKSLY